MTDKPASNSPEDATAATTDAAGPREEHLAPAAPVPTLRLADSLATAGAGEILVVDRRGRVMGRGRRRLTASASWATLGGAVAFNGLLYGRLLSPFAGACAAVVTSGYLVFKLRKWPAYRAAMALAADSRWEEAHSRLAALRGGGLPRVMGRSARIVAAALDQILGRHQVALDRVDAELAELGDSANVMRWQAVSVRAMALIQLGRFADARLELEKYVVPRTDYVELLFQNVVLSLAFEADAPETLPADDVLHEWARAALQRSRYGETLVGLAWALHRRGDDDMARHLLAESASRMPRSSLPTAQPRLEEWALRKREEWAMGAAAVE